MRLFDRQQRRFLVIDEAQFILVEPDTTKLGWGVVKFVARLQVTSLSSHTILAVHSALLYRDSYYCITTTLHCYSSRTANVQPFCYLRHPYCSLLTRNTCFFRNANYQSKVDNYRFILNFDEQESTSVSLKVVYGYILEGRQTKSTGLTGHFSVYDMSVVSFETRSTSIAFLTTTKLLLLVSLAC